MPSIFITDFERTENSDELHGIFGRALVVAARFDALCEAAAILLEFKESSPLMLSKGDANYQNFVLKIIEKFRTLNININALWLPDEVKEVLHAARDARNHIAHELTRGMEGCLDEKVNDNNLMVEISGFIEKIAYGDLVISFYLSLLNNDPLPTNEFMSSYKNKLVNWVVDK